MRLSAALLGSMISAIAGSGAAPIGPSVTKYRLESSVEQAVDLSSIGQPEQRFTVTQVAVFSIALTDSAGGQAMHVTIDSVNGTGTGGPPPAALDSIRGAWIHGFRSGDGATTIQSASNESSDVLSQLKQSIQTFFPRIRGPVKTGDRWVDTTEVRSQSTSRTLTSTIVTSYVAAGEESFADVAALRLDATVSTQGKGTVANPQLGEMTLTMEETATAVFFVSADGRYLGGRSTGTAHAALSAPMLPASLPLTITRETKISVVE